MNPLNNLRCLSSFLVRIPSLVFALGFLLLGWRIIARLRRCRLPVPFLDRDAELLSQRSGGCESDQCVSNSDEQQSSAVFSRDDRHGVLVIILSGAASTLEAMRIVEVR